MSLQQQQMGCDQSFDKNKIKNEKKWNYYRIKTYYFMLFFIISYIQV